VITHPEKVLFPDDGITKGELAAYYEAMAPVILPHLRGRPVTMERYPAGIDKKGFWQKDVSKGFPAWLQRVEVAKKGGVVHHPLITDVRSLLWVTNQNTVTQHVWPSQAPKLKYPDLCVFDLDPSADDAAAVRAAAIDLRALLEELTLPCWIKTTGSKGFHIVVPLDGTTPTGVVARFANAVGTLFVSRAPDRLTQARLTLMRQFVLLFYAGVYPDVMHHRGRQWENVAAQEWSKQALIRVQEEHQHPHAEH